MGLLTFRRLSISFRPFTETVVLIRLNGPLIGFSYSVLCFCATYVLADCTLSTGVEVIA